VLKPAQSLDDVYKTLSPEPLLKPEQLKAFYRSEVNQVRGDDKVARIALALNRASGGNYYKAFLMGHSGVGKSTELSRLVQRVEKTYRAIRFGATTELDPANFKPFDVVLLMMVEVASRTAKPVDKGGAGQRPSDARLQEIWQWFATETNKHSEATRIGAEVAAGAGVTADSWWAKALGLFGSIKGEIKYASDRKKEIVEYRLLRLRDLVDVANRLLDECNSLLKQRTDQEWLYIGEEFDKPDIPVAQVESLFLNYANIFRDLRTHLIFTIPITLGYSQQAVRLPFAGDRVFSIPDTPVFSLDHTVHAAGRQAIGAVLEVRVAPHLFEDGQMMRLIVASGGNLRDLFSMVSKAADNAILRGSSNGKINHADADFAINEMRTDYVRRLGDSPFDKEQIAYEQKAQRLLRIYHADPKASVPDSVLFSLLRSRAAQEFNGQAWLGVHPLVVDILKAQDLLAASAAGGAD